jgi:hypothetical protein
VVTVAARKPGWQGWFRLVYLSKTDLTGRVDPETDIAGTRNLPCLGVFPKRWSGRWDHGHRRNRVVAGRQVGSLIEVVVDGEWG